MVPNVLATTVIGSEVLMHFSKAAAKAGPSLQVKVTFEIPFLKNSAFTSITNMANDRSCFSIASIAGIAVEISAAIACTAKYMDLNGFLFKNLKGTEAEHVAALSVFMRMPAMATAGTLSNVKRKNIKGFSIFLRSFSCLVVSSIIFSIAANIDSTKIVSKFFVN